MTVDQMYRCVLLDKNTSKMFNFGGNNPERNHLSILDKVGQKSEPRFFKEENSLIESKFQKRSSDPEYRKISKIPFKVLDAPNLQDDFYLNLL